ncbi:Lrp/AsnC family transcriptional regulator [Streptomyces sp. AgN23]|uniref:Lrp/AsnC family transcriptional regulator n=1 Tax=Streptomyces sp. AgN23 TaxID=1188315 RepID=UPI001B3323AD|nr:Lrp/AsnC family transcriptional regulator [Streptomyces sp. AgN23]QTI87284.1 Lrp/AsnC family transcriptional regulator [Streptomyces sp. AgN23]
MADSQTIDSIDRMILDLLIQNGRRTVSDIAERVNMSPSPVKRRIDRLERMGVIVGYTALVDHSRLGAGFEAFTEVRFAGDVDVDAITDAVTATPEVVELFTTAGDPDALVRVRVNDVQHLRRVIDAIRRSGAVIGTKTLMVLGTWRR